ncbi:26207_t:CDS:2, partial [Dentiscutata erythropus]
DQIKSKNDNALIIDISQLLSSFNEIVSSLHESAGNDIVAIKQHLKRGSCSQLEIGFILGRSITDAALNALIIMRNQTALTKQYWLLL